MIWRDILTATVRHLLAYVAAWMVMKGVIDEELSKRFLADGAADIVGWLVGFVVMFLPILWSWRDKIRRRVELITGLEMSSGTPEALSREVASRRPSKDAF